MVRIHTRSVLFLTVAVAVVLAGCTGGGGTPTATAADGTSDGSDGNDASAGGSDGSDGDGDGGADSGDGAGDGTTPTPTATPTPNASGPTTTERLPRMSGLLELENSYRFTAEFQGEEGTITQEGRWYETDFAVEITFQGQDGTLMMYNVGESEAYETGGECFSQDVPETRDPGNWTEAEYLRNISVRPSRTTTIDGEEVSVYETESGQASLDGPFTYYVSAETGHLRKQESADATIEMYDWGHGESVDDGIESSVGCRLRGRYLEPRAAVFALTERERPAVGFDDALDDREAESGSVRAGRIAVVENLVALGLGNPVAVVFDEKASE
jgi:hypothetical protein